MFGATFYSWLFHKYTKKEYLISNALLILPATNFKEQNNFSLANVYNKRIKILKLKYYSTNKFSV